MPGMEGLDEWLTQVLFWREVLMRTIYDLMAGFPF